MLDEEIIFFAAGGAQNIGNSCYYLKLGNQNILLDCGMGKKDGYPLIPNIKCLLQTKYIESTGQLSQIYISHAHWDHVGYLDQLYLPSPNTQIFMTEITRNLTHSQILQNNFRNNEPKKIRLKKVLHYQGVFDRIVTVNYHQKMDFGVYKAYFLPAGHIPGAMMILFRYKNRNILYTGDYSFSDTPLTGKCYIPEKEHIDTLIMCGTHARHSNHVRKFNEIEEKCLKVLKLLNSGISVYCQISQLSKGVEVLAYFNKIMAKESYDFPIIVETPIWNVIKGLEKAGTPILREKNNCEGANVFSGAHIVIGVKNRNIISSKYRFEKIDFTLHDDFNEMTEFIKTVNPRQVVIVHSPPERNVYESNVEQVLFRDSKCNSQFLFPEEGQVYRI